MGSTRVRSQDELYELKEYLNRRLKRFTAYEVKCFISERMFCDVITCLLIDKYNQLSPEYFAITSVKDDKTFYTHLDKMIRKVNRKYGM